MKKRILCATLAAMMTAAALTGCSGSSGNAQATTAADGGSSSASSDGTAADVKKIRDLGVLKVGRKSDVPKFSLQNTATGEYEGFEDDLAYNIAGEIFGCTADEAKEKKLVEF